MSWKFVRTRWNALLERDPAERPALGDDIRMEVSDSAVSLEEAPSVRVDRGRSERVRMWRRRVLLRKGARIHLDILRRADDCSMAVLDPCGMVVCWYGRSGEHERVTAPVLNKHVSQFYTQLDIATYLPDRDLRAAVTDGISRQEGWRLSATGRAYWAVTDIRAMLHRDGRLQGFVHVIRPSRGPWEGILVAFNRPLAGLGQTALMNRERRLVAFAGA